MRRAILLLAALAACGGPAETTGSQAAVGPNAPGSGGSGAVLSAALRFDDVEPPDVFASVTQFSIASAQVYIAADWQAAAAVQSQRVDILDPSGLLYSSTTTQFATTVAATGSQVQAVPLSDGSYRVWNTFQIAGTPVEAYHLVGAWTVSVSLDGGAPLTTSTFTLN